MKLALAALAAQLLDLATFGPAVARAGIGGESNVVIAGVYGAAGLPGVALVKLAGVVIVVLLALRMRRGWAVLLVLVALGLFGMATNLGVT